VNTHVKQLKKTTYTVQLRLAVERRIQHFCVRGRRHSNVCRPIRC